MVISSKGKKNRRYRFMSWLLAVLMLVNLVNPAASALGENHESDSWDLSYSLSLQGDGDHEIADENGEITLAVKEGEEVFFAMQMIADRTNDPARFEDTFRIRMPDVIYRALTDINGEPGEWFVSGMTDSGYLLELKDPAASSSNAKQIFGASGADARRSDTRRFVASPSDASPSEIPEGVVELDFRFAESLREELNPEDVVMEDTDYQLSFTAPEDMVLVCRTDSDDCEITVSADTFLPADNSDSCWNVSSSLVITRDGQELMQNPRGFIYIIPGDTIEFGFRADIKSNVVGESGRYEETFKVIMPEILYEIVKDKIIWPECGNMTESGYVFKNPVNITRNAAGNYVLEFEFEDFSNAEMLLTWAGLTFQFEAKEKIVMGYEHHEEDDSTEVSYRTVPKTTFMKEVLGVISENELRYGGKAVVSNGDYVLFKIRVQIDSPVAGEEYVFDPNDVYDFFYEDAYKFVDITSGNPQQVDELISWIKNSSGATEKQKEAVLKILEDTDDEVKAWNKIDDLSGLPAELEDYKDSHHFYGNSNGFVLDKQNNADQWTTIDLYMCLQLRELEEFDIEGTYTEDDEEKPNSNKLHNSVFLKQHSDGKIKTGTPGADIYYDTALTLTGTSIWHSDTEHVSVIGKNYKFPGIEGSELAVVRPGDYVTYRIQTFSQGSKMADASKVSFYLPRGLEPVTQSELAGISGFKYACSPESPESIPSQWGDASSAAHVYPVSDGGGVRSYDEYEPGGLSGYGDLYGVRSYTYTYDPQSRGDIYITCQVRDIKSVIAETGFEAEDPAVLQIAERYAYLLTAEITEAADAYNPQILIAEDGAARYKDCDSLLDGDPFNDWYNVQNGAIKNSELYYYSGIAGDGEQDHDTGGHVRGKEFGWNNPAKDEDDFDFSLVYPHKVKTAESSVIKEVYELSNAERTEMTEIIGGINPDYMLLTNGTLTRTQTVIPYIVKINPDGSRQMDDLVFEDKLPASMSFLTFADGTPVVKISERVERDGHRYPAEGIPGGIIEKAYSDLLMVKSYQSEAYIPQPGSEMPGAVKENEIAGIHYWSSKVDPDDKTVLTIDFGNIENNSFEIIYYAVVDRVSNAYKNVATISWGEHIVEEAGVTFSKWEADATAGAYSKFVALQEEGPFDKAEVSAVDLDPDRGLTVYYRLGAQVSPKIKPFAPDTLLFVDHIENAAGGGQPMEADISILKMEEKVGDITKTFPAAGGSASILEGELFEASVNKDMVQIGNPAEISETAIVNVYIAVHYAKVDYGIRITNVFQNTTEVTTPLKLDLTKVDGHQDQPPGGLAGAQFALTYEDGASVLQNGADGDPVILETADDGKAGVEFYLDPARKNTTKDCYYLHLTETKAPEGYYGLGGISGEPSVPYVIKLKVTQDQRGTYLYQAVDENPDFSLLTTGSFNQIQITVKNYQPSSAGFRLKAHKELAGRSLKDQEFTFKAVLIYASDQQRFADLSAVNDETGAVGFDTMQVKEAGRFVFEIYEERTGNDESIYYDTAKYYAAVTVTRNSDEVLEVTDLHYGDHYDQAAHEVSGPDGEPVFKNQVIRQVVIKKISSAGGGSLSGAVFELSCRKIGSDPGEWNLLSADLVTGGADGSVSVRLPADEQAYEYRLIETEAPAGYRNSQVGIITFTVGDDGELTTLSHTGTDGYVEQGSDKSQIIVKNDTIPRNDGGDDDDDDDGDNPPTTRPAESVPEEPVLTDINEEDVPLALWPDLPVPLSRLALTGDISPATWLLIAVMLAAVAGGIVVICLKRKGKKKQ